MKMHAAIEIVENWLSGIPIQTKILEEAIKVILTFSKNFADDDWSIE